MKVGIVIPDGTGIRNYLFSNLVDELRKSNAEIVLYHSVSKEAIREINKRHTIAFEVVELPVYYESPIQKFYRETICFARLLFNSKKVDNPTILKYWNPSKNSVKNKIFYTIVEFVGKRLHKKYATILAYETKYNNSITKSLAPYLKIVEETKPDILFSTHQRSMNAVPLVKAAKLRGIHTVGAIFSWDNLPKARLTVRTDSYVVWSDYMKSELNTYYPEIKNDDIVITGTPQFEFYNNTSQIVSKEVFFKKYDLDSSKKTLCFSGDDVLTSPFDPTYLEDIVEVIAKQQLNIQILLRRAPVDVSGRFDAIVSLYPEIVKVAAPIWNFDKNDKGNWQVIYPTYKDVELLVNTVYHCDAVINLGSTMALDFVMYKKPAIYLNYNAITSERWNVEMIYNFQHFRTMKGLNPVIWLNSKDEIESVLELALNGSYTLENVEWLDTVAQNRDKASENIAKYLMSCI